MLNFVSAILTASLIAIAGAALVETAQAQSLKTALELVYQNNPELAAARAGIKALNENVSIAKAGWRPSLKGSLSHSLSHSDTNTIAGAAYTQSGSLSLTFQQSIYRGGRTVSATRQAEAAVFSARENLRDTEQRLLFTAATAYLDVIRDSAILKLRKNNLTFLSKQVIANKERFEVGENTKTDVAQSEARRSAARSQLNLAQVNLYSARAVYEQIIGQPPGRLEPNSLKLSGKLPSTQNTALNRGLADHPAMRSAEHSLDAARHNIKLIIGELKPSVSLSGTLSKGWADGTSSNSNDSATITGTLSFPIYQGGSSHARVRQAKHQLGQAQLNLEVAVRQIRAAIIGAWGQLNAADASVTAARDEVTASQIALDGVIEERSVGQRTALEVLDAQRALTDGRVSLVIAERNRELAAFSVLQAIGDLNASRLGLRVALRDPAVHYEATIDRWFGLRLVE